MARRAVVASLAALVLASCGLERASTPMLEAEGPPSFDASIALTHAEQFEDDELRDRRAGSEGEQAAAVYILGILQRNGYLARLDAVPVQNLYRSTNVIAYGRDSSAPEVIVVVPYDEGSASDPGAEELGVFLEVSRALNAAAEEHDVWFAAVGADAVETGGGNLGSRRLARFLLDQELRPHVIQLVEVDRSGALEVGGDPGPPGATLEGTSIGVGIPERDVFGSAGFDRTFVGGGIAEVGEALVRSFVSGQD